MPKSAGKVVLALVSLVAMSMALFQLLAPGARMEDQPSPAVQQQAREESRLRAEIKQEAAAQPPGDQLLPNAVIRRGESGGRSLQQVLDSQESQEAALDRVQENLDRLAGQIEDSNRALRRDVEELRADLQREREASRKTLIFLLVALIPLVIHLLASLRRGD
jgi:flagellar motility protein MotE (MotC chaperone)